jgi:hypothetical protein
MTGQPDNMLIKAVAGLEGGCVACGSTCGVVSGGALGLAHDQEKRIDAKGGGAKKELLEEVGNFADWFGASYGSNLCRERSQTNFYSLLSQLKYLFTFYNMAGCFRHINGSMKYLHRNRMEPVKEEKHLQTKARPLHCAEKVLQGIRKKTDIGEERLEKLSFVFDGGVGLSGGLCGALVGAVLSINLLLGKDIRSASFAEAVKGFCIGHVNLLLDKPMGTCEPFQAGKQVVENFKQVAGSFECREIAGREFSGWDDFQEFICGAKDCHKLMDFAVEEASRIILQYHSSESPG